MNDENIIQHITNDECNGCGGATDGYKCPKCGRDSSYYEPFHFKSCKEEAKMRAKCKKCSEAEDNCKC